MKKLAVIEKENSYVPLSEYVQPPREIQIFRPGAVCFSAITS